MNLAKDTYDQHTSPMQNHINVGCGQYINIATLARTIGKAVGYQGRIDFDPSQPDGVPRKPMDSRRINALGWQSHVGLERGLALAYADFLNHTA